MRSPFLCTPWFLPCRTVHLCSWPLLALVPVPLLPSSTSADRPQRLRLPCTYSFLLAPPGRMPHARCRCRVTQPPASLRKRRRITEPIPGPFLLSPISPPIPSRIFDAGHGRCWIHSVRERLKPPLSRSSSALCSPTGDRHVPRPHRLICVAEWRDVVSRRKGKRMACTCG